VNFNSLDEMEAAAKAPEGSSSSTLEYGNFKLVVHWQGEINRFMYEFQNTEIMRDEAVTYFERMKPQG